ncbi:dTDP-4-dehydrorhamnose 3,5-epimerase family protein [Vibrio parahaemolyticus]|uniref:dTDP-4-dehydrorhamnose 3,5-epimerase family protein n=1 Tax=Vibrio parahaemolyticus TaxID=670 RepID=UPI0015DF09C1|nr:dTDP-4-dehydrorhamnose 3,5-epimerase family protein [Vibrio parahaemolyticus]
MDNSIHTVLADDDNDVDLIIKGLCFRKNNVTRLQYHSLWFSKKLSSSSGPLISDFVTHGREFEYSTFGIHVGQVDRLTFLGNQKQEIIGHFVDCRENSPTLHQKVSCKFSASPNRKLIIPRGVAHTFDNLAGIVTRDEPIWYSSESNTHWNVNNDLISILRTESNFPIVKINEHLLPDELHVYLTRLSQAVLDEPKPYSTRFNLEVGGEETYVMFQENSWDNEGRALSPLLEAFVHTGLFISRSKYAITGKASWTVVPNTGSGVADVLLLNTFLEGTNISLFVHRRTRKSYTFLTNEGQKLIVDILDLRPESESFGKRESFETVCDPRICFTIEPGVAYCFRVENDTYVRTESEVFVAENEPREDLPHFGIDIETVEPECFDVNQPSLPSLRCPDEVVRQMAKFEIQQ